MDPLTAIVTIYIGFGLGFVGVYTVYSDYVNNNTLTNRHDEIIDRFDKIDNRIRYKTI